MLNEDEPLSDLAGWSALTELERGQLMQRVVSQFGQTNDPAATAALAIALAGSGDHWRWPTEWVTSDVPSTGGAGSLVTLVCPPILASCGAKVPKLGVPGATAGALDVLALLGGYRVELTYGEARLALEDSGVVNCAGTDALCPADRDLFRYRVQVGMKSSPSLVAASLLSKKLAVGCLSAALEVRCGMSGNVGHGLSSCLEFADLFRSSARLVGVKCGCVITRTDPPATPLFGRLESLQGAVSLLRGDTTDEWNSAHADNCLMCSAVALLAAGLADSQREANLRVREAYESGRAYDTFLRNLRIQGSSEKELGAYLNAPVRHVEIAASCAGYAHYSAIVLREMLTRANGVHVDAFGLRAVVMPDQWVENGDILARMRYRPEASSTEVESAVDRLRRSMLVMPEPAGVEEKYSAVVVRP